MRDWEGFVERRLAGLALEPEERTEVIAEVAAHLEDICAEMLRQGMTEEEAVGRALSQVRNWKDLQCKISAEKRRGQPMEKRVRQLWIPGFLTLILSMVFLTALQRLGLRPRIVWSGPNAILLYMPWLVALPFFGALGAYVSSRAGGSRGSVVFASVFPVLALTTAFLLMFPIGLMIERITGRPVDFSVVATVLLRDGIGWILVPGAALLVGGLLAHFLLSTTSSSRRRAIG